MIPVIILAGGAGTRLAPETADRPKALVEVGGIPLLTHVLNHFLRQGFADISIAAGRYSDQIRQELARQSQPASVRVIDTGEGTSKIARIRKVLEQSAPERFFLAWCDQLCDIDLGKMLSFHEAHQKLATVAAVKLPLRYGHLDVDGELVTGFREKTLAEDEWINGGYFILDSGALEYSASETDRFETDLLPRIAADSGLMAWKHHGFWKCVDTVSDLEDARRLAASGDPPWSGGPAE